MTDPFVRAALIGIGRDASSAQSTGTPTDALFESATADERTFLLRAAARDVYVRAGLRPPKRDDAIEPATPETLQRCSARLTDLLTEVVREDDTELLYVAAEGLRNAGLYFPHALLPNVLTARERQLRAALAPTLGERGRWLARRNPAWSWAADASVSADVATLWEEGTNEAQVEALRVMRAADAASAREKLAERLPKEKAEQRAAYLAALAETLSIDDEPLLERALDDRSINVKAIAAELLARLPSSAFVQRMTARAEAIMPAPKTVEPPFELDAAAVRDILPTRAPAGTGARAYILTQIVGAVPLSSWTTRFDMPPGRLIAKAAKTDWSAALVDGWLLAAVRQHDAAWARELMARNSTSLTPEQRVELVCSLPPDERMRLIPSMPDDGGFWPLEPILESLPRPWPKDFAREWLQRMRRAAAKGGESLPIAATAGIAARAIPLELCDVALNEWTIPEEGWYRREWERRLHHLSQIIRIRKTIAEESRA